MLQRSLEPRIRAALADTPVVLLQGARQTGKSTLVQQISASLPGAVYRTLDDFSVLSAIQRDPQGFIEAAEASTLILDEIQLAPEVFRAIKWAVDRNRRPGQILLTGSANALAMPRLSDSLAGRMDIQTLLPLSQTEIAQTPGNFVDLVFANQLQGVRPAPLKRQDLVARVLRGGYPEAVARNDELRREDWFASYMQTLIKRDVRDLARIEGLAQLPSLLTLLASRSSGLLNLADVSRAIELPRTTLARYLSLLEAVFMVTLIQPWLGNAGAQAIKAPKVLLNDSGVMGHLLQINASTLKDNATGFGPLLETFVVNELRKMASWSSHRPILYHYRTRNQLEVDAVLVSRAGAVAGLEIKASASISSSDWRGLRALADDAGSKFTAGIMLYTGNEFAQVAPGMFLTPISALF